MQSPSILTSSLSDSHTKLTNLSTDINKVQERLVFSICNNENLQNIMSNNKKYFELLDLYNITWSEFYENISNYISSQNQNQNQNKEEYKNDLLSDIYEKNIDDSNSNTGSDFPSLPTITEGSVVSNITTTAVQEIKEEENNNNNNNNNNNIININNNKNDEKIKFKYNNKEWKKDMISMGLIKNNKFKPYFTCSLIRIYGNELCLIRPNDDCNKKQLQQKTYDFLVNCFAEVNIFMNDYNINRYSINETVDGFIYIEIRKEYGILEKCISEINNNIRDKGINIELLSSKCKRYISSKDLSNQSDCLYISNFDIFNKNTHRSLTNIFLKFGPLSKQIKIGIDPNNYNPYCLVQYQNIEHSIECFSKLRFIGGMKYGGRELNVEYCNNFTTNIYH